MVLWKKITIQENENRALQNQKLEKQDSVWITLFLKKKKERKKNKLIMHVKFVFVYLEVSIFFCKMKH